MKPFLLKRLSLMISLMFVANIGYAEVEKDEATPAATSGSWQGYITPKLGYFNNSGNASYLNQYNLLDSTFSHNAPIRVPTSAGDGA